MHLFTEHFGGLRDVRLSRKKLHSLHDILFICICGVICGEEDFVGIEMWAEDNEGWLAEQLDLKHGIPSHDTLNRVFQLIDYEEFSRCFISFTGSMCKLSGGDIIAIDGKCLRGTKDKTLGKNGLYMVGAWASGQQVLLGQERVEDKSNEITAIPKLLECIAIKGCTLTIDAMGCQREIAEQIIDKEAHYVLSVKGNQASLEEQIQRSFGTETAQSSIEKHEKDHGRIETRKVEVITDLKWIEEPEKWKNLNTLIKITSERTIVAENKTTHDVRYFIASQDLNAEEALRIVRSHWGIENQLHWSLDVTFNEDQCRTRTKNAAENLSFIRRIALNLLKKENTKISLKHKQHKANRSNMYLQKILNPTLF
jgi:predicted transposase YbfD/YdcC